MQLIEPKGRYVIVDCGMDGHQSFRIPKYLHIEVLKDWIGTNHILAVADDPEIWPVLDPWWENCFEIPVLVGSGKRPNMRSVENERHRKHCKKIIIAQIAAEDKGDIK